MAPTLAQSTARNGSVIRAAFTEIVSFIFIFVFLIFSLYTNNETFSLIKNPIFVTLLFIALNTPLQITLHLVIYPLLNPNEGLENYPLGKKKLSPQEIGGLVLRSIVAFVFGWIAMHVTAVLFGAHFVQDAEKTTLWAAMVSALITAPGMCILGPKPRKWIALLNWKCFDSTQTRTLYFCIITTALGCWISPVVIPLDWNMPWQLWPVPGVVGALLGYCVGLLIGGFKILKEMKFSKLH